MLDSTSFFYLNAYHPIASSSMVIQETCYLDKKLYNIIATLRMLIAIVLFARVF